MITLFACPKPFLDPHISVIQRNAIRSWTLLEGHPEVILVGDEPGMDALCSELGIRHIARVACNEKGTPRLNSVFWEVQSVSRHAYLCYINADIILLNDFVGAARRVMALENALMIGARTDLNLKKPLNFDDSGWDSALRSEAVKNGKPMRISSDYFLFKRGFYDSIPSFLVGRPSYDNWMIWYAKAMGARVVDASGAVLAIHQDHGQTTSWINTRDNSENDANRQLAGPWRGSYVLQDADAFLSATGVRKRSWASVRNRLKLSRALVWSEAQRLLAQRRSTTAQRA